MKLILRNFLSPGDIVMLNQKLELKIKTYRVLFIPFLGLCILALWRH